MRTHANRKLLQQLPIQTVDGICSSLVQSQNDMTRLCIVHSHNSLFPQDSERHRRYLQFRSVRPFLSGTAAKAAQAAAAAADAGRMGLFGVLRRRISPVFGRDGDAAAAGTATAATAKRWRRSVGEAVNYDGPEARRHRLVRRGSSASMESAKAEAGSASSAASLFRARRRRAEPLPSAADPADLAISPAAVQEVEVRIDVGRTAYGSSEAASTAEVRGSGGCRSGPATSPWPESPPVAAAGLPAHRRLRSAPRGLETDIMAMDQRTSSQAAAQIRVASPPGDDGSPSLPGEPADCGSASFLQREAELAPGFVEYPSKSVNAGPVCRGSRLRRVLSGAQWLSTVWSVVTEGELPLLNDGSGVFGEGSRMDVFDAVNPPIQPSEAWPALARNQKGNLEEPSDVGTAEVAGNDEADAAQGAECIAGTRSRNNSAFRAETSEQNSSCGTSSSFRPYRRLLICEQLRDAAYKVHLRSALQVITIPSC